MTTFLTSVGIIALFILGKFIYDTYFTNKTDLDWNKYAQKNPEYASRIERSRGFDFSTKSKSQAQDKLDSLFRIAENFGCSASQVKDNFIENLNKQLLTAAQVQELIQAYKQNKYEESLLLNIDPTDTASAHMEEWTIEYLNNKEYANRKRTAKEVIEDHKAENKELSEVIKLGDKIKLNNFMGDNRDLMDSMFEDLFYADKPAERFRKKAIDKMFDSKDYLSAINLINKGLELDEHETEPYLFELRSGCAEKLLNYTDALSDINKAIESILKHNPDNAFSISNFLKKRSQIKQEMNDTLGANLDMQKSLEYYDKHKVNNTNKESIDDLPF